MCLSTPFSAAFSLVVGGGGFRRGCAAGSARPSRMLCLLLMRTHPFLNASCHLFLLCARGALFSCLVFEMMGTLSPGLNFWFGRVQAQQLRGQQQQQRGVMPQQAGGRMGQQPRGGIQQGQGQMHMNQVLRTVVVLHDGRQTGARVL